MPIDQDEKWMQKALQLAEKGWGRTNPNPLVGCVIVRDGHLLADGYHAAPGLEHAERAAVRQAREKGISLRGSTLYVNLEPCSHHGRTPPCADLIVEAGISAVVAAMTDPNPKVAGRGFKILRDAGIEVRNGVLEAQARRHNEIFIKYITTGQPFILMKTAISIDGKIATCTGESKWISGGQSRQVVHHWRDRVAAIMVGKNTILADDPSLTTRLDGQTGSDPVRVIIDSAGTLEPDRRVFQNSTASRVIFATTSRMPTAKRAAFAANGVSIVCLDGADGRVDLRALAAFLGQQGLDSVLLEGGGTLNEAFLHAGLIDKIMLFMAPVIIGGCAAVSCFHGSGFKRLSEAVRVGQMSVTPCGDDWLIEGYPQYEKGC